MKKLTFLTWTIVGMFLGLGSVAQAKITISPYASVRSTKSVKPQSGDKSKEESKTKQHEEYGLRGAISFWRLFKFQLSLGQSQLTQTTKVSEAKDEYGEIDFEEDANLDTSDPDRDSKIREAQKIGRASVILDPGFWIFIARFKAGVTATQREIQIDDGETTIFPPTYKPHSGAGLGVRLGRTMHFMMEYNFFHYKFPEIEPFEREVAVSFGLQL